MRKKYTTEGKSQPKKGKVSYPKLVLCDVCVREFVVISEGDRTYEPCEKCGADSQFQHRNHLWCDNLRGEKMKFIWLKVLITILVFAGLFGIVYYKVASGISQQVTLFYRITVLW